jgi:hypothetical protein
MLHAQSLELSCKNRWYIESQFDFEKLKGEIEREREIVISD